MRQLLVDFAWWIIRRFDDRYESIFAAYKQHVADQVYRVLPDETPIYAALKPSTEDEWKVD